MHVELYEKIWMWAAGVLVVLFLGAILVTAGVQAVQPPSHVETLDPATLSEHPEFGSPAVTPQPDGSVRITVVAQMYAFTPEPIEVPANVPVTFRITSADIIHGFEVAGTNANAMAIPGYVSQFTTRFTTPGKYQIVCNEYCGLVHHTMVGTLVVK